MQISNVTLAWKNSTLIFFLNGSIKNMVANIYVQDCGIKPQILYGTLWMIWTQCVLSRDRPIYRFTDIFPDI